MRLSPAILKGRVALEIQLCLFAALCGDRGYSAIPDELFPPEVPVVRNYPKGNQALFSFAVAPVGTNMVDLSWTASPAPIVGYLLWQGVEPGIYSNSLYTGNLSVGATNTTAQMLRVAGFTNYYMVVAVGTNGFGSVGNPEVAYWTNQPVAPKQKLLQVQGTTNFVNYYPVTNIYLPSRPDREFYRLQIFDVQR